MNFLAHLFLASPDEDLMIGNFIADSVKGKSYLQFPHRISKGILMHRFIDDFTDTHPLVKASNRLLHTYLQRYAPVALDIFYDYFLAKNFQQHHQKSLEEFAKNTYQILEKRKAILPEKNQTILHYMSQQNWLVGYATIDGIKQSLNGVARRSSYGQVLQGSEVFLLKHETELKINFEIFFEELKAKTEAYKKAI